MERFAWNGLQKDVREWTRCCIPFQTTKVHRHNKAPIGTLDAPDARSIMFISIWPVPFPHHEGTVSSLFMWVVSLDGVKPSRWSAVTPRPPSSPSFRTGLFDLAHLKLSQRIAVPSLNQRFSPNCVNCWIASVSEQPHITQPPTV